MEYPSPITRGNRDLSSPHPHLTHDHTANPEVLSRVSKGIRLGALGLRWWSGPKRTHNGPHNSKTYGTYYLITII